VYRFYNAPFETV